MRISRIHKYVLDVVDKKRRVRLERQAQGKIREQTALSAVLDSFIEKTQASGASYADYLMLYTYVRTRKPKEILECGTGVTTVVMAQALHDNEKEGVRGRLTSMEDIKNYYENALSSFPEHLKKYVDFVYSPKVEDYYHLFRGARYRDVPSDRQYEFVYIDGPKTSTLSDKQKTFDFDFIRVIEHSEIPVFAFVDTRMSTCWALKHLLKEGKVRFDYVNQVGIIGPCTKDDLQPHTNKIIAALGPRPIKGGSIKEVLGGR